MTRYGFAKILESQESGWSGNKPNQRGKYILVPKPCRISFPPLSTSVLNDQQVIKCITLDKQVIGLNIIYHNAKFFPETHKRKHDEFRIYRNAEIDEAVGFERGKMAIFLPWGDDEHSTYVVMCISEEDPQFDQWKIHCRKPFELEDVKNLNHTLTALRKMEKGTEVGPISNFSDVTDKISSFLEEQRKQRTQQDAEQDDPARILLSLFKNQPDFARYLHQMYGYKCAIRGNSLVNTKSCIGLEAAHIKRHTDGGPLLPTNGILMSVDLHRAFDKGAFALTEENRIEINPLVPGDSEIWHYNNQLI